MQINSSQIIANAAIWAFLSRWSVRLLGIISSLILLRLLEPDDFGIVAVATFVFMFTLAVTQAGSNRYLVREREVTDEKIHSIWSLEFVLKSSSAFLVLISAYPVSIFMEDDRLFSVVAVCALIPFIQGFRNASLNLYEKTAEYKKFSMIPVYAKLVVLPITVLLAYLTKSYWALVVGLVVNKFVDVALGYLVNDFRPKFSTAYWKDQWSFSKWVFISSSMGYMRSKIDILLVGKIFGTTGTGILSIGREFSSLPATEVLTPLNTGFYAAVAQNYENRGATNDALIKQLFLNFVILIPCIFGYFVIEDLFIDVVLGEKWSALKGIFAALSLLMVSSSLYGPLINIFTIYKKLNLVFISDVLFILLFLALVFSFKFEALGEFIEFRVLASVIFVVYLCVLTMVVLKLNILFRLRFLLFPISISFLMVKLLGFLSDFLSDLGDFPTLLLIVAAGGVFYAFSMLIATYYLRRFSKEFYMLSEIFRNLQRNLIIK